MAGFLNILAALLLTILPALRPCDCRGFSFTCTCALASRAPAALPSEPAASKEAPAKCCCCGHAKTKHASAKADDSRAQDHKPGLPAPRKPGSCLKFAAQETGAAVVVSVIQPTILPQLCDSVFPAMQPAPSDIGPVHLQAERPPPLGLVFAGINVIRI